MDKSALTQAMKASISEVLEQMFFMTIDFIGPEKACADPEPDQATIIAKLGFSGSCCGTFVLLIPAALAQSVAADFLGITRQSLSREQVTGTVLEMVNMLAGSTLSTYDHQALFNLQIPELITINAVRALTGQVADQILVRIQTPESRMTFQVALQ
jgi:CheY-specific phosphatase CheX